MLDIIIFVPYNLFRLFLVHNISTFVYIYRKRKKEKEKERDFLASWAEGHFGPAERGRARKRAGGPLGPPVGNGAGMARWGGLTAWSR